MRFGSSIKSEPNEILVGQPGPNMNSHSVLRTEFARTESEFGEPNLILRFGPGTESEFGEPNLNLRCGPRTESKFGGRDLKTCEDTLSGLGSHGLLGIFNKNKSRGVSGRTEL